MTGQSRRAETFVTAGTDRRFDTRTTGDERAMLTDFLDAQRATLELKCAGLADLGLSRRAVPPSTLSLLGIVRHLADVERRWFRCVLAGKDAPPRFSSRDGCPDGDFEGALPDPDVVAGAWEAWRDETAFADRFTAAAPSLDVAGDDGWRGTVSLRWVPGPVRRNFGDQPGASGAAHRKAEDRSCTGRTGPTPTTRRGAVPGVPGPRRSAGQGLVHMVEEYARHNGHADLLRERIDGARGL